MVQRTSEKRTDGRDHPKLNPFSHCYLCSILHSSVRQAVGHKGEGRVYRRVARIMTMADPEAVGNGRIGR
jgi:hypothetical protein